VSRTLRFARTRRETRVMPSRVRVVIPAQNEQALLPACLRSMLVAARHCPLPVDVVVVLDDCTDGSASVLAQLARDYASQAGTSLISRQVHLSNVGRARALGVELALADDRIHDTWLATTDADSTVPAQWLRAQLDHAREGASVVVGTVRVADWGDRPPDVRGRAEAEYVANGHRHVHGANLSFTAAAYRRSGGFAALSCDEDIALVHAFEAAGETLVWATDLAVNTSGRRLGRAPAGFAGYLDALEEHSA
jgi:glycosyltransferase involved in cell wall biosynthesis